MARTLKGQPLSGQKRPSALRPSLPSLAASLVPRGGNLRDAGQRCLRLKRSTRMATSTTPPTMTRSQKPETLRSTMPFPKDRHQQRPEHRPDNGALPAPKAGAANDRSRDRAHEPAFAD
jgi:hypothetical protein